MKREDSLFVTPFLGRFSSCKVFPSLCAAMTSGLLVGSGFMTAFYSLQNSFSWLLFLSGRPETGCSFFSGFSSILLNLLFFLILLYLLGMTIFGAIGVPVLLFFRGAAVGAWLISFFSENVLKDLPALLLCYLPATVAASLLMILFGTRALIFSRRLAKVSFSAKPEDLDFVSYLKDFLTFICFAVCTSLFGGFLLVLHMIF